MGALSKDPESGVVRHDKQKCIGCKSCIAACPFGGMSFNVDSRQIFKCEHCDGQPQCVRFCVDKAITYVDAATVSAKRKRESAVDPTCFPPTDGSGH